ncbi:TPA: serine protease [Acinetobacter baumannii]|nr:serine protease [Acinetobacter baumannii]
MAKLTIDKLSQSTVLIDPIGKGKIGTGFVVSAKKTNKEHLFLVTNKHIALQNVDLNINFIAKSQDSKTSPEELKNIRITPNSNWAYFVEDHLDLAILEITFIRDFEKQNAKKISIHPIPFENIANKTNYDQFKVLDDVYFFGYPKGIHDPKTLLPMARKGHLASSLSKSFNDLDRVYIDGNLIDGTSGCPIFCLSKVSNKSNYMLVGVGHAQATLPYTIAQGIVYDEPMGLGIAIKSNKLIELINHVLNESL